MEKLHCVCRLCMNKSDKMVDALTTSTAHEMPVFQLIHSLFSFWIKPMDSCTVICQRCLRRINQFYHFYKLVKNSQLTFDSRDYSILSDEKKYIPNVAIEESGEKVNEASKTELKQNEALAEQLEIKEENVKVESDESLSADFSDGVHSDFEEIDEINEKSNKLDGKNDISFERGKIIETTNNSNEEDNLDQFPIEVIKNGIFTLKGRALTELYGKFYSLECELCKCKAAKFRQITDLFTHYKNVHKTKGYVRCCNTPMRGLQTIKWHMVRHLQPSAFECQVCNKVLCSQNSLNSHKRKHLPDTERPYKCDQCSKAFLWSANLKKHKSLHSQSTDDTIYSCDICDKTFKSAETQSVHIKYVHSTKRFLCPVCAHRFQSRSALNAHMFTHDADGNNSVQCGTCLLIFKNKRILKIHQRRHLGKTVHCSMCNYKTTTNTELKVHIKIRHSDVKPYACSFCDKRFKIKNCAKVHEAQHTGERKYSCPFCTKTFVSSGNFYTHRKRMHPEERNAATKSAMTRSKPIKVSEDCNGA